jgi:CDK inhibitor PHO81
MLPPQTGVCLELAIAAATDDTYSVQTTQLITTFSDSVLRTIYRTLDGAGRRRIVLTSFSPDLCASLNWKQPNCK